jgi:hypothetical protein
MTGLGCNQAERKFVDLTRLHNFAWHATIPLRDGMAQTDGWFLKNLDC